MLTGGPGSGSTKMANQIAIAGCVAGVAEAIRYGEGRRSGCIQHAGLYLGGRMEAGR